MVELFGPVRRTTLSREVADRLAAVIRSGALAPGSRLPAERVLGEQLGVGRTSIREALRMLQATGMITVRPGHGVFVADLAKLEDRPFAQWEARFNYRVEELIEARLAIEPMAAACAARRSTPDDLHAIHGTLAEFQRGIDEGDLAMMVLADSGFHYAVAQAARNRVFQSMLQYFHHLLIESQRASLSPAERPRHVLSRHHAVYAAIAAGDAATAETAMRDHLMSFVSDMAEIDSAFVQGFR